MVVLSPLAIGAHNPFIGTWKFNSEKSKIGGQTVTYSQTSDGIKFSQGGLDFTFKMDGRDYPTQYPDYTNAWTQIDDHSWKTT